LHSGGHLNQQLAGNTGFALQLLLQLVVPHFCQGGVCTCMPQATLHCCASATHLPLLVVLVNYVLAGNVMQCLQPTPVLSGFSQRIK